MIACSFSYALKAAQILREKGVFIDLNVRDGKLGNQIKHFSRLNRQYVIILGEEEEKTKTFTLKNLETGHQEKELKIEDIVTRLVQVCLSSHYPDGELVT